MRTGGRRSKLIGAVIASSRRAPAASPRDRPQCPRDRGRIECKLAGCVRRVQRSFRSVVPQFEFRRPQELTELHPVCYHPPMDDDQLIALRKSLSEHRAKVQEQLRACESGKFKLFEVGPDGVRVDVMADHIAMMRRIIADYDRLIGHFGGSNATRP